jgi:hypothetical protein
MCCIFLAGLHHAEREIAPPVAGNGGEADDLYRVPASGGS